MSNIRVGVGKKGIVLALIVGVLLLGGGGGYLLWRVNQEDTVAPTDSDASGCSISRVSGDTCRARGAGECNEDEAGAGTLCCKPYKKTCLHTIKYIAGTGGTIVGNATQNITSETISDGSSTTYSPQPSTVTATPNSGYRFVKWSDNKTTAARKEAEVQADVTFTATFEAIQVETVTLTYTAGANGKITGTTPQTINKGASGTAVTATPNTGYKFVKWSDNKTTTTRTDTNVQASATYTATFEILPADKVTLTYVAGTGGTITGTATQTIDKGASGTAVTATPNTGYAFEKWSDNKTTATRTDTNVQVSATYTATFKSTSPTTPVNCTGFTLSCGANNTININWNLVTGAVKYIARINKAPKSDWLNEEGGDVWIALGPDVNSYVIQNAQSGVVYGVNVLAYDGPDGQTDFHPSCNMTGLGQIWDPPMYIEIACQGTSPIVVPDTGIFDNSKHTVIFGFVVLVIGLAWTWISTLPKKALFAISSTSSKIREDSERRRVENRRERLEKRIK